MRLQTIQVVQVNSGKVSPQFNSSRAQQNTVKTRLASVWKWKVPRCRQRQQQQQQQLPQRELPLLWHRRQAAAATRLATAAATKWTPRRCHRRESSSSMSSTSSMLSPSDPVSLCWHRCRVKNNPAFSRLNELITKHDENDVSRVLCCG